MVKIFSFFSGLGFLDFGFEKAGYEIVYVNEIHKPFLEAYKYSRIRLGISSPRFGYDHCSIEDLFNGKRKINLADSINLLKKNEFVGFIGGPPCPDFSVGGKNRGKHGDNGRLSKSYINAIILFKPHFFLFENVRGLWRTKKHREFYEELKKELIDAGYILTERLINSIEYGVPQDRDRIILFGLHQSTADDLHLEYNKLLKTFPYEYFGWEKFYSYKKGQVINYSWPTINPFQVDSDLLPPKDMPLELTVQRWFDKNDVQNHPNSIHYFQPRAGLEKFLVIEEGDVSKKSYKRLHRWRYSPTVAYGNNEVHLHPYKPRRISVAEALSLQSLPKDFLLPEDMSLTNMFKGTGNGVPFLAAKSIAKTIKNFLRI